MYNDNELDTSKFITIMGYCNAANKFLEEMYIKDV